MSVAVNYTNASGVSATASPGTYAATNSNTNVSQNQFLSLLVTEMKNQDPTKPVSQTRTLTQLAQFSELEQMTNLNQTMTANGATDLISQNAGLIGKTVTASASGSAPAVTGVVSGVTISNGSAYLQVGGQSIAASSVTQVQ